MKKVLSVAMASAMVLGMGANAFAIQYNTGSNDTAAWPKGGLQFDGALFVTDKNGDIITQATTEINKNEAVDFQPGDVIWMPLYAEDQLSYSNEWSNSTADKEAISDIRLENDVFKTTDEKLELIYNEADGVWEHEGKAVDLGALKKEDWTNLPTKEHEKKDSVITAERKVVTGIVASNVPGLEATGETIKFDGETREVAKNSHRFYINGKQYKNVADFEAAVEGKTVLLSEVYATVNLVKVEGNDEWIGKPSVDKENGVRAYGHYTGKIDKNWSINLIEKSTGVADLIEKAELYKATANDYASYTEHTAEIKPNAVYLKITLKKEWKTVSNETLKYYVYIANNKNNGDKTNEVWVSGKYAPTYRTVDFTWTNNANEAGLWKAEDNGVAVFDFADKAFFTVKMYKGETMFLDLSTAYDKVVAGEMDVEADSFYKFDNTNASFARTGELVIVSDDDTLVPYEIDADGNFVAVDAEYVKDYAIAHTNSKVNGFVFKTNQLGNYVLATEELGEEAEEVEETEEEAPAPVVDEKPAETAKPNPNTGAEDFVGLAVSLAVVSVAAAGALALKK